jgi:hypothetical protein
MSQDWLPGTRTGQLAMIRNWISVINAPGTTPLWTLYWVFGNAQERVMGSCQREAPWGPPGAPPRVLPSKPLARHSRDPR